MLDAVNVDREQLLSTLKENKTKHITEYDEAVTEYRALAEKALRRRASDIRDGKTLSREIDNLPVPVSFADDYDRAIAMVEWSTDPKLQLDDRTFRAWVLDEWNWRGQFAVSTAMYNQ